MTKKKNLKNTNKTTNKTEALKRTLVMSSSEFSILERILGRFVHFSVTTKYLIQPNFTQSQNSRGGKGPPEVICSNHPTHAGPP